MKTTERQWLSYFPEQHAILQDNCNYQLSLRLNPTKPQIIGKTIAQ